MLAIRAMSNDVRVLAIDRNPSDLINEQNLKVIELDFSNKADVLSFARKHLIDGVYPMNDHAVRVAAYVADEMELLGLSIGNSENFIDKSRMRTLWDKNKLNQPRFRIVKNYEEAVAAASEIGLPVIVKPAASGGGGRGVTRVDKIGSIGLACDEAHRVNQYSKALLVEEFIEGVESSIEMAFIDGIGTLVAISSKVKANSVKQVAIEINYPAQNKDISSEKISSLCQKAGLALGISNGATHFEVITNKSGIPFLVEVGGRVGGGHTFHPITSHVSGIDYPRFVANLYVGNLEICAKMIEGGTLGRGAVYAFPITYEHGIIREITFGDVEVANSSVHTEVWRSPGDIVSGLSDSLDRLGCVIALAPTHRQAELACRRAMSKFVFKVERLDS